MKGYFGRQEETDTLIDADGWLHTGDIGTVDEHGWWHIVDRVKELIKYKGYQVAPAELEAVLLASPDVADAAVIGVYDERGDEVPKAFVVRAPGSSADRGRRHGVRRRAERPLQAGAAGGVHRGGAEVGERQDPAPRAAGPGEGADRLAPRALTVAGVLALGRLLRVRRAAAGLLVARLVTLGALRAVHALGFGHRGSSSIRRLPRLCPAGRAGNPGPAGASSAEEGCGGRRSPRSWRGDQADVRAAVPAA